MPRAVKKWVSRSSRNSNSRKWQRDITTVNMIGQTFPYSSNESIADKKDFLKLNDAEKTKKLKNDPEVTSLVSENSSHPITTEINDLMAPLFLLNLRDSISSASQSSEAEESFQKNAKEVNPDIENSSGVTFPPEITEIRATTPSNSRIDSIASIVPTVSNARISSLPTKKLSISIRPNPVAKRIFDDESESESGDESSDSFTARKIYFEDISTSHQKQISAQSVNRLNSCWTIEEPMDVSMEEISYSDDKFINNDIERQSIDSDSDYYNSDDNEFSSLSRTSQNNFVPRLIGNDFREEIIDAAKWKINLYDKLTNEINSQNDFNRKIEDYSRIGVLRSCEANYQTDFNYSNNDFDVEMNSFNNEAFHQLQSIQTAFGLQENIVEWMDQDLEYVADTEDFDDPFPLTGRSRISSFGDESTTSIDQGFVEGNETTKVSETKIIDDYIFHEKYETTNNYWNKNSPVEIIQRQNNSTIQDETLDHSDWSDDSETEDETCEFYSSKLNYYSRYNNPQHPPELTFTNVKYQTEFIFP